MTRQHYLLISGSRQMSEPMRAQAWAEVQTAKAKGLHIVVGDAPGVDTAVLKACIFHDVPVRMFGITREPRVAVDKLILNSLRPNWQEWLAVNMCYSMTPGGGYLARDRVMCEYADEMVAIWNGFSTGTKYTYDYMRSLGRPSILKVFRREPKS